MNQKTKKALRRRFFAALGPNAEAFKSIIDASHDICFNMKDTKGRIMALNPRNCEVCNIRNEWDAIGLTSADLFPPIYAQTYMTLDREALKAKAPIRQRVTGWPADRSRDFMISDLYPLRDAHGQVIGTAHAYQLSRDIGPDAERYGRMRIVSEYIERHFAEDLSLERLAEIAGYPLTTFRRAFRAVFGMTAGDYLMTTRINAARKRLERTKEKLSTIATACGFYDQSHFSSAFKRCRGITPSEYRRHHRSQ